MTCAAAMPWRDDDPVHVVWPKTGTPRITAAQTVLGDDRYRRQARELEHEMEALPGIDRAVHLLETLAAEAQPSASAAVERMARPGTG